LHKAIIVFVPTNRTPQINTNVNMHYNDLALKKTEKQYIRIYNKENLLKGMREGNPGHHEPPLVHCTEEARYCKLVQQSIFFVEKMSGLFPIEVK